MQELLRISQTFFLLGSKVGLLQAIPIVNLEMLTFWCHCEEKCKETFLTKYTRDILEDVVGDLLPNSHGAQVQIELSPNPQAKETGRTLLIQRRES